MAKITVPNNDKYNGIDFGVPFVNGIAETNNEWLITMFNEKGYTVEQEKEVAEEVVEAGAVEAEPEQEKKAQTRKTTKKEG